MELENKRILVSNSASDVKMIDLLRNAGKLKALPIVRVDSKKYTLYSKDGIELREYGLTGTWIPTGDLHDGTIRYLGSASHAGHIELKALFVWEKGLWYNIVSGVTEPYAE